MICELLHLLIFLSKARNIAPWFWNAYTLSHTHKTAGRYTHWANAFTFNFNFTCVSISMAWPRNVPQIITNPLLSTFVTHWIYGELCRMRYTAPASIRPHAKELSSRSLFSSFI